MWYNLQLFGVFVKLARDIKTVGTCPSLYLSVWIKSTVTSAILNQPLRQIYSKCTLVKILPPLMLVNLPKYLAMGTMKAGFWATIFVLEKVLSVILNFIYRFMQSFNRSNLKYDVRPKKKNLTSEVVELINNHFQNKCGIVYCLSRCI